jgi:serine/threonine protein phosphatase PrpC
MHNTESKGSAAVSWLKNSKDNRKPYEDRYRFLTRDIPLVGASGRGELLAVMDGIGGAPMGMAAAQAICDAMVRFYKEPAQFNPDVQSLTRLLYETNLDINEWGCIEGTDRPLGGAAGTIVWIRDLRLTIFHAGDTAGLLLRQDQPPRLLTGLHEYDGGITRYFGLGRRLEIEVKSERLEYGDLILLVSDGVTKVYSTTEAANLVLDVYNRTRDVGAAAQELAIRSRGRKSSDDITVMVIEVEEE